MIYQKNILYLCEPYRYIPSVHVMQFTAWKEPKGANLPPIKWVSHLGMLSFQSVIDCSTVILYHCFRPSDFVHQNIPPLAAAVYLTTSVGTK